MKECQYKKKKIKIYIFNVKYVNKIVGSASSRPFFKEITKIDMD